VPTMSLKPDLSGIQTEAQHLASLVARSLPVTVASVALWDEPRLALTVKAVDTVRPVDRSLTVGVRVPFADAPWHRNAFEQNELVLLEEGSAGALGVEQEAGLALIPFARSVYLVPIRFAGETVGMLILGEARAIERERFSSEKRERCRAIVDEFVTVTAHAWEARLLRRQVRSMSSLMQLVRGVATARSYDDVLVSLGSEVADWLGIPVRAALLGMTDRKIQILAHWRLPEEILGDGGRQMFLAMTRSDALPSGPVTMTVAGDDPLDPMAAVEPAAKRWTRVGVPLMRDERLIGVACLYLEEEIRLADWELEALRRRGEIAAVGVESAGLIRVVEVEQESLHRVALELLTGYRWALVREVFAGLARTLPASLHQRLSGTLPGLVDQSRSTGQTLDGDRTDLVSAVVAEVTAVFSELWDAGESAELVPVFLDVNDIVARALRIVRMSLESASRGNRAKVDLRFEPTGGPVVIQGSLVLVGALVHAIESAVDAMPAGGEIRVRTGRENGHAVISVEDSGAERAGGADSASLTHFSLKDPGTVLSLVRSIVEPYGGRATLLSREASGSALVLHLPAIAAASLGA
jgi:signal transduction histidine kinase